MIKAGVLWKLHSPLPHIAYIKGPHCLITTMVQENNFIDYVYGCMMWFLLWRLWLLFSIVFKSKFWFNPWCGLKWFVVQTGGFSQGTWVSSHSKTPQKHLHLCH